MHEPVSDSSINITEELANFGQVLRNMKDSRGFFGQSCHSGGRIQQKFLAL